MPRLRTIRQEPRFDEQLGELGVSHKRLDEVLAGAAFGVSHAPENYPIVPGTVLRVLETVTYPNAPSIRIFFTFDDEEVHFLHVEFCEEVSPWIRYDE